MIYQLGKQLDQLGDSPPNPRLGDGCVPQTPSKIIVVYQFIFLTELY
ncbi:hypothetical protein FDUTEX481_04760 [Tolypothrix sp. PCC 7601]|nr:hypothetical protein FDUTEX481_04760 [Tolypothrix sp. PCC 7601]